MKYKAEIEGHPVSIELEERDGRVRAVVGQHLYDLEAVKPENGLYVIFVGDRVYEARVWVRERNSLQVKLRGRLFDVKIIDRKHRRPSAEQHGAGLQKLISPMPGKVVRVLLGVGDEAAPGQGVVVVEAMKMQNEIKSRQRGRVLEVLVSEGDTVKANQVLAIVE
jgi:biotin carboxyl carrier protein